MNASSLLERVADLLFPPRCAACGTRDAWLCDGCRAGLARLPAARCRVCGAPLAGITTCSRCYRDPPRYDALRCAYVFEGPVRALIHRLKYRRGRFVAPTLAALALEALEGGVAADLVVPVPLHPARQRERGHNQAALLADEIGRRIDRPVDEDALARVRDTPSQVGLPPARRWENVRGAFEAAPRVRGRAILLVDDVCTTGATLDSCAAALRRAGAGPVVATTVARVVAERDASVSPR